MRKFLLSLLSGDESQVDAVVFCMVFGLVSIAAMGAYQLYMHSDVFSISGWTSSFVMVVGVGAAGKTARDRLSGQPQPSPALMP